MELLPAVPLEMRELMHSWHATCYQSKQEYCRQGFVVLRVLLVDDDAERSLAVEEALLKAGYAVVAHVDGGGDLHQALKSHTPDLILLDIDSPDRDVLESLGCLGPTWRLPVVLFSQQGNDETIALAAQAGVSAYVTGRPTPESIKPAFEIAMARFRDYQALKQELNETREKLADRKLIDRAKGVLMSRRSLSEDDAYKEMRKLAMNRNVTLGKMASVILDAAELLS
jgi:response regulator NasT